MHTLIILSHLLFHVDAECTISVHVLSHVAKMNKNLKAQSSQEKLHSRITSELLSKFPTMDSLYRYYSFHIILVFVLLQNLILIYLCSYRAMAPNVAPQKDYLEVLVKMKWERSFVFIINGAQKSLTDKSQGVDLVLSHLLLTWSKW